MRPQPYDPTVWDEFCPSGLLRNVSAGLVVGSMVVIGSVSFAALIFSGPLSALIGAGIGMALASGAIVGIIGALAVSHPATVSGPHGSTSSVLALLAAGIAQQWTLAPATGELATTVVAAIAVAGLLTGCFLAMLGWFRLGNFIRFIPYPVVGGFVAGTGWLLARGSMVVMTGTPLTWAGAADLLSWQNADRWFPGTLFAAGLLLVQRRWHRWVAAPAAIAAAIVAFHLTLVFTGVTIDQARADGWLLPAVSAVPWTTLLDPGLPGRVEWPMVLAESGTLATVVVLAAVVTLFGATTFELMTEDEVDLNRDLRGMGIANLAIGAMGGVIGLPSPGFGGLSQAMGAGGRLAGCVAGIVCGAVLVLQPQLVGLLPTGVIGGVVMFNGLSLLAEWLVDQRARIPRFDHAVMLIIVAVMAWFGFLQGVAVGLVTAGILFVISYSRIDVVRHALTGETFQSSVERSEAERAELRRAGASLEILALQGFVFFGTAHALLERVRTRLERGHPTAVRFVVLDFRLVTGIDSSAVLSLRRLVRVVHQANAVLVASDVAPGIQRQLGAAGAGPEPGSATAYFPDLDHAVEWCEDRLLAALAEAGSYGGAQSTSDRALPEALRKRLSGYLETQQHQPGTVIFQQGASADGLVIVVEGSITVQLERADGRAIRLHTHGVGAIVGEVGLYLGIPRSASVVALEPTTVYRLSNGALARMEQEDPSLAADVHRLVARRLAERLVDSNRTLDALSR